MTLVWSRRNNGTLHFILRMSLKLNTFMMRISEIWSCVGWEEWEWDRVPLFTRDQGRASSYLLIANIDFSLELRGEILGSHWGETRSGCLISPGSWLQSLKTRSRCLIISRFLSPVAQRSAGVKCGQYRAASFSANTLQGKLIQCSASYQLGTMWWW